MPVAPVESGFATLGEARLYYEVAGKGRPFVMIHAGVADCRQWNHEFATLADGFRVLRYDMRGYGKSEPGEGEFSHMGDLIALLDQLGFDEPLVLMGCSMGGGLAMDFALSQPSRARALIMVDSAPSGLELDLPTPAKFAEAEAAYNSGNLELLAELETQIWFDGEDRTPAQVDQAMRRLVYEMDRHALALEARHLGKRTEDSPAPAAQKLAALRMPVLVIVGEHDTPYILAAADYMLKHIESARKVVIKDAAHLPNLDHPDEFRRILQAFLNDLPA